MRACVCKGVRKGVREVKCVCVRKGVHKDVREVARVCVRVCERKGVRGGVRGGVRRCARGTEKIMGEGVRASLQLQLGPGSLWSRWR